MVKKLLCCTLTTLSLALQPVLAELLLLIVKSPLQSMAETCIGIGAAIIAGGVAAWLGRPRRERVTTAVSACEQTSSALEPHLCNDTHKGP